MECPKCGTEMVKTESWGLQFFICPKCGVSYDEKPSNLADLKAIQKLEKPKDG